MSTVQAAKQFLKVGLNTKSILDLPPGKGDFLDFIDGPTSTPQRPTSVWNDPVGAVVDADYDLNHYKNYLNVRKAESPGKQGESNFISYTDINKDYATTFQRDLLETPGGGAFVGIQGKWYRAKSGGTVHKKGEFAGSPTSIPQERSLRHKHLKTSGETRNQRMSFDPNQNGKSHFNSLSAERARNNKRDGFKGGSNGWLIEHNIPIISRYFYIHNNKHNSDPWNVFLWLDPQRVNYKGEVEKHLKSLKDEPLASKIDLETDEMVLIDIDLDREVGRFPVFKDGFRTIIQNIIKARKAVNELPIG